MKKLLLAVFLSGAGILAAQSQLSVNLLQHLPQQALGNPAFLARQGWNVCLPDLHYDLYLTGVSYNRLVKRDAAGRPYLDFTNAIDKLSDHNDIVTNLQLNTLHVQFGGRRWSVGLHHGVRFNTSLQYPKTLPSLFFKGNSQYIGKEVVIGPDLQLTSYHEFGLAGALHFQGLSLGGRVKWLSGIGNISTERTFASLYTSDDVYQLRLRTDYLINSAAFFRYNGLDTFHFDVKSLSFNELFSENRGFAFDIGAAVQLSERLTLTASATDIGGLINWKKNTRQYESKGTYEYAGLDLKSVLRKDSVSFEGSFDTLKKIFRFEEKAGRNYSSELPLNLYASAQYMLSDVTTLGALYGMELYRGKVRPAIVLSANFKILELLNLGAAYTTRNFESHGLGLNIALRLGPVQLFALTDNVLAVFSPFDTRYANGRVGVNLVFNKGRSDIGSVRDPDFMFK